MATLRRGLVDQMKKAAKKVSTRGAQVAAKAGTRGARALVETTVAAVKTMDKLQEKLGRRSAKASIAKEPRVGGKAYATAMPKAATRVSGATARTATQVPKTRRPPAAKAQPVVLREGGRKTMPAAAAKRAKKKAAPGFKVKRGQKHLHSGR